MRIVFGLLTLVTCGMILGKTFLQSFLSTQFLLYVCICWICGCFCNSWIFSSCICGFDHHNYHHCCFLALVWHLIWTNQTPYLEIEEEKGKKNGDFYVDILFGNGDFKKLNFWGWSGVGVWFWSLIVILDCDITYVAQIFQNRRWVCVGSSNIAILWGSDKGVTTILESLSKKRKNYDDLFSFLMKLKLYSGLMVR